MGSSSLEQWEYILHHVAKTAMRNVLPFLPQGGEEWSTDMLTTPDAKWTQQGTTCHSTSRRTHVILSRQPTERKEKQKKQMKRIVAATVARTEKKAQIKLAHASYSTQVGSELSKDVYVQTASHVEVVLAHSARAGPPGGFGRPEARNWLCTPVGTGGKRLQWRMQYMRPVHEVQDEVLHWWHFHAVDVWIVHKVMKMRRSFVQLTVE